MAKNATAKLWNPYLWPDGTYRSGPQDVLFYDDFAGTVLNPAKWVGGFDRIQDLVNGEVGGQLPDNVVVNNGLSILSKYVPAGFSIGDSITAPQTVYYSAGQIQQATAPFKYGVIDVRCRMPGGTGLWPLVWMLGFEWQASQPYTANVLGHNWPHAGWCEIDIAEFLGNQRNDNNCAVWFYNANTGNGSSGTGTLPYAADSRFMIYRLEWRANKLEWSVDAEDGNPRTILRTITDPVQIPDVPMYVVLSTATGGTGGGTPNPATFPQTQFVSWVRVAA
jgi:beta-glucanase (GH16 family)